MQNNKRGIQIGLCNQKGGVAKTTSAAALSTIFGQYGLRVLAVDCDPQANLSLQFGIDATNDRSIKYTISDLYLGKAQAKDVIISTRSMWVDLIPASLDLAAVEIVLPSLIGCDLLLRSALKTVSDNYDLIILDSPPNLGKFAINVLNASDYFLVPVKGAWGLRGVDVLIKLAQDNARTYNLNSQFLGVFLTMTSRTNIIQLVREEAETRYPGRLFTSEIRTATKADESAAAEMPIPEYAPSSPVSNDYEELAREIAARIGLEIPQGTSKE